MTKVFLGGSRRVSRLSPAVSDRLDKIVAKNLPVVVGDASGADKALQRYLANKRFPNVEVFCSGAACRNNVGGWPLRHIDTTGRDRNFDFYAAKDRAMAREATHGFMIWDGKSKGTLLNVLRLLRQDKKVVVYDVPAGQFSILRGLGEWESFMALYGDELRNAAEQKVTLETRADERSAQDVLLPVSAA